MSSAQSTSTISAPTTYGGGDAISGSGQSKWITFALIGGALLAAWFFFRRKRK
jgi:LPXTG-motif cell wall-anchored protein